LWKVTCLFLTVILLYAGGISSAGKVTVVDLARRTLQTDEQVRIARLKWENACLSWESLKTDDTATKQNLTAAALSEASARQDYLNAQYDAIRQVLTAYYGWLIQREQVRLAGVQYTLAFEDIDPSTRWYFSMARGHFGPPEEQETYVPTMPVLARLRRLSYQAFRWWAGLSLARYQMNTALRCLEPEYERLAKAERKMTLNELVANFKLEKETLQIKEMCFLSRFGISSAAEVAEPAEESLHLTQDDPGELVAEALAKSPGIEVIALHKQLAELQEMDVKLLYPLLASTGDLIRARNETEIADLQLEIAQDSLRTSVNQQYVEYRRALRRYEQAIEEHALAQETHMVSQKQLDLQHELVQEFSLQGLLPVRAFGFISNLMMEEENHRLVLKKLETQMNVLDALLSLWQTLGRNPSTLLVETDGS